VLGYDEFYGLRIKVSTAVLVPRPETEELVERVLDLIASVDAPRILDVGTGSGCIALALAHERPDATVAACDVSDDALAVAQTNGRQLELDVTWFRADLFAKAFAEAAADHGAVDLDLLVSNPPYIPEDDADRLPDVVRDYDPPLALFAGDDPLRFYRRLAEVGRSLCRPGGVLAVETHADYAGEVEALLRSAGWTGVRVAADLSGRPRIVYGRRKGEKRESKVEG
jgi:release factor glutamine methyltransferase